MKRQQGAAVSASDTRKTRRPNVVFILIDDLGWADLGCYGSTFYETPALDRLAADGAMFTDAYAASPVCSPTRASIMSGKYPANVGVTQFIGGHGVGTLTDVPYFGSLPTQEYSLARALRDCGYRTWHVGKWHLGPRRSWPDQHGFEKNIGGCDWGQPRSYFSPYGCPTLADGADGEYLTDRLTDEAIALIEDADDDTPFFLNLWHYAVHVPIQAPPELIKKYETKANRLGLDDLDVFEDGGPVPVWHNRHERIIHRRIQSDPVYAAMIENLDRNVGRIVNALERTGKRDETILVFTTDNGGLSTAQGSPTSNLPLADGKGWMSEGGIRGPLLLTWPGVIERGTRVSEPVTSPDLYPTILAAAGIEVAGSQQVDGVNLLPLVTGGEFERGRPLYWHYPHYCTQGGTPMCGIRQNEWKLVRDFESGRLRLYDVEADPGETRDLSASHQEISGRLAQLLDEWLTETGALIPARNPVAHAYEDLPGYYAANNQLGSSASS